VANVGAAVGAFVIPAPIGASVGIIDGGAVVVVGIKVGDIADAGADVVQGVGVTTEGVGVCVVGEALVGVGVTTEGVGVCVVGEALVGVAVDVTGARVVSIVGSDVGEYVGEIVGALVGANVGAFVGEGVVGATEDGACVGMLDVGAIVGACDGQSLVPWRSALVDIHGTICNRFTQFDI
jgi:hypothetical protein